MQSPPLNRLQTLLTTFPPHDNEWSDERANMLRWGSTALVAIGLLLVLLGDGETGLGARLHYFYIGLLMMLASLFVWLLAAWRSWLTEFSLAALLSLIGGAAMLLPDATSLLLVPLPIAFMNLVGYIRGGLIASTAFILWLWLGLGTAPLSERVLATIGVVGIFVLTWRLYKILTGRSDWAWQHYTSAQRKLEDTRDQKQQLDAVLEELLRANRQLDLVNERLAAARTRAEETQQSKSAFVAKVSHEFRTPLNMIIGLLDLLVETPYIYGTALPSRLLDDLRIVHRNCEHLSSMINDVLDLSQTEAGRLTLRREVGDLREDIWHAVEVVHPLAAKKGLDVRLSVPDSPVCIAYDQRRIRQVLLNLLSNAARHTTKGQIGIHLDITDEAVTIGVTDTGPGISAEDLTRIFEPFFQSDGIKGRSQAGTGLGLSISQQFVDLHGGKLWVESSLGTGSTFFLRLPTRSPLPPPVKPDRWIHPEWEWHERQERAARPELPRQQRYVLFDAVEDIHPLLDLASDNMELLTAHSLEETATLVGEEPVHAVMLNAANEQDLLALLPACREQIGEIPIIGWTVPSPLQRALTAGALDYLVKPITRSDLFAALAQVDRPIQRVLIVDDDVDVQRLITRMLHSRDKGIRVTCVPDSHAAIYALETQTPDLVLLDIMLRIGTGWDVLAHKENSSTLAAIPAIIVSAQDPMDSPPASPILTVSTRDGLGLETLLRASQAVVHTLTYDGEAPRQGFEAVTDDVRA